jgi:hypothetical protein
VRPDGYIAWRQPNAVWDDTDALDQLQDALGAVLDRPNRDESATSASPQYSTRAVQITVPQASPTDQSADRPDTEENHE